MNRNMSTSNNLGQKNPLLQRVRRHTEMAMLFRSPRLGQASTWTAEIVNHVSPQAETMPLSQDIVAETGPLTPPSPVPSIPPTQPTTQRKGTAQNTTESHQTARPTLWQRAKGLFRKQVAPSINAIAPTQPLSTRATEDTLHAAPLETQTQPSADTYHTIQRQSVGEQLTADSKEVSKVGGQMLLTTRNTTYSMSTTPSTPLRATYPAVQRQQINNQLSANSIQPPEVKPTSHQKHSDQSDPIAPLPHHPIASDTEFPWSSLQAVYNSHHPDENRQSLNVNQQTTPAVQRQPPPPAVPDDGSFPWGALQNIYDVHQKAARQEQEATMTEPIQKAEATPLIVESHLPEQAVPLEAIWPVEKTAKHEETAAVQPIPSTMPIQRTAADQAQDAQVRVKLQVVTPAHPSDSSVELVTPRRPRPAMPGKKTAAPAVQRKTKKGEVAKAQERVGKTVSPPAATTIETEIGPLPADLWDYIGTEPPIATPTNQEPTGPASKIRTTDPAVQRHIAQAESPPPDNDVSLPATSLSPIIEEQGSEFGHGQANKQGAIKNSASYPTSVSATNIESQPGPFPRTPTTAAPTAIQRKEQKGEALEVQDNQSNATPPPSTLPSPPFSLPTADLQHALPAAEASLARPKRLVSQPTAAESTTNIIANQVQAAVAQRHLDAATAVQSRPQLQTGPPDLPIRQQPSGQAVPSPEHITNPTATFTSAPSTSNETPIQRASQPVANPASILQGAPTQITTIETAVPPHLQKQSDQSNQSDRHSPFANHTNSSQTAVTSSPTETNMAQTLAISEEPTNGRTWQHQSDPTGLTNMPVITEQVQRAIHNAESAPTAAASATSNLPPTPIASQESTPDSQPATATIQRTEEETAAPPHLQKENDQSDQISQSSHLPPTIEQTETAEPDIDELAREVYCDLKRRLTIEWERTRGRITT